MQTPMRDEQESPAEHAQETPQSESGEFTINPDQIESGIKQKLDGKKLSALNRILDAGNKLIFGKDTHYQILEDLTDDDDTQLSRELGEGAANLAVLMFKKSGGTMPQELIVPAGVILLARVCEFGGCFVYFGIRLMLFDTSLIYFGSCLYFFKFNFCDCFVLN